MLKDTCQIGLKKFLLLLESKIQFHRHRLLILPMRKYFKLNSVINIIDHVLSWRSKEISNESIKQPTASNYGLNPKLSYYDTKIRVQFTGSCLKQSNFMFTHKKE